MSESLVELQTAINDLAKAGYSEARIAEELRKEDETLQVAQSTIHRIRTGKQSARYDLGVSLIRLRNRLLVVSHNNHESSGE